MDWTALENRVRTAASYIWNCEATAEVINGVRCDCVLKPEADQWIAIEITKEADLSKLRTDLAKFATIRPFLFSQNVYVKCLFVTEGEPTESMIQSGKGQHVEVLSANTLAARFFDHARYAHARIERPFGSAVDPESGGKDEKDFVPVVYDADSGKKYSVESIAQGLRNRKRFILLGSYGTGKSRCTQEVFELLSQKVGVESTIPFAISLREQWGVFRAQQMLRRHMDDVSLSNYGDAVVRMLGKPSLCLLLDGFDELGSQSWTDDAGRLRDTRKNALAGVRDLISGSKGGVLITGREHYFNSDEEMFHCLGLNEKDTVVLRCPEQFTEAQIAQYLKNVGLSVAVPHWLPRRPLICQILATVEAEVATGMLNDLHGELSFWDAFVSAICEREAKIHTSLDAGSIRKVLLRIARFTRRIVGDVGPIPIEELHSAFFEVLKTRPVEESAIMLQRLPPLGRVGSESQDRQFVDAHMLDALRAQDVVEICLEYEEPALAERWQNPLRPLGLRVVAATIDAEKDRFSKIVPEAVRKGNRILACDLVASMCAARGNNLSLGGVVVRDGHVSCLDLEGMSISNGGIEESFIDELMVVGATVRDFEIKDCIIRRVKGITDKLGLPLWCKSNQVETFESVATVSRIRQADLSREQRIFVTIVKKIFFQPGSGRKEEALLRGLGESEDKRASRRILNRLFDEGMLTRIKGNEGWIYAPQRKHTKRLSEILHKLTLSDDPLWLDLPSD